MWTTQMKAKVLILNDQRILLVIWSNYNLSKLVLILDQDLVYLNPNNNSNDLCYQSKILAQDKNSNFLLQSLSQKKVQSTQHLS